MFILFLPKNQAILDITNKFYGRSLFQFTEMGSTVNKISELICSLTYNAAAILKNGYCRNVSPLYSIRKCAAEPALLPGTVKKIVVALSTRQKLLGTVSLYVRHFCPCNNTYQLIFHQLVERRAGISANSNYFGNSHSCQHSKCQNFCCSFPPTTNYVDATVSAAASWSKIFMYFAIIGSNLTCCRENFKCH